MTDNEELKHFIQKLHLRTFSKIMPHVSEKYPNATEEQVKDIIKDMIHDPKRLNQKQYYNKIFSDHPHAWQMDLLDNSGQTQVYTNKADKELNETTKHYPIYWYLFINVNTRYAVAYPIYRKTNDEIFEKLKQFISEHKCSSLTSDKESSFVSEQVTNYLTSKHISQYIVLDENHTSLAIIDSFIRHLRDMNIINEKSKYQSHHSKYRNFSVERMEKIIDIYNNTVHSAINMKPKDMESDEKKEREYIAFCLIRRSKAKTHDIPTGHFVRIVLSKELMKKRRFKLSREVYTITGREGKNYIISAADNTSTTLPRHRLIDIGATKPDKFKLAETLPEGYHIPTKIINKESKKFLVQYGEEGAGDMRKVELRRHHPQIKSKLEKEFEKQTTIRLTIPKSNDTTIRLRIPKGPSSP